ncbi:HAD family hydrolase [Bowmanella denitrificans]|uniref:HAD family hydrolase n=1 Tax=Bowmanella denitrificans TaxID=366582 RepID=UPI000C9BE73A|nr:HAD-IA family hydrolase [Bowmanella denitrificans]
MTKPRAGLLFDLDGTLLDTARDMGNALNMLLAEEGRVQQSYQSYRPIASHGAMGMLKLGFAICRNDGEFEALRQRFLHHYRNTLCQHTCLFDGIEALLLWLNDNNIPWGIVTNKPTHLTLPLLEQFPLLQKAAVLVCGDTLTDRKPSPKPLFHAANQLNLALPHSWYVGDAERDMLAAKSAGMQAVLAEYGYICPSEQPQHWQVDQRIAHPVEISNRFKHKI